MGIKQVTKPIRICFISPKAYPLFNANINKLFGGAELDLYLIATELAKDEQFEVSFITADYSQKPVEIIEGVKVIKSVNFKQNPLLGAIKIWQAMNRADAEIYMIKTISMGMFWVAFFCKFKNRMFTYRTASKNESDGKYLKQNPIKGMLYKRALNVARFISVQNTEDVANLKRTTGADSMAIRNGHRIGPLKNMSRDTVLWVGRSAKVKRPELFIELAEKIPKQHFTMICQHATADKNFDALVSKAAKVENLKFIDHVPFKDVEGYFQQAKVFVNTSDSEGFPNTFIQAGKFAVPILSLNVNPDNFLDHNKCGICANGDWAKFVDALEVVSDPENRYGENGLNYIRQNHDMREIVERYKSIFRKLI